MISTDSDARTTANLPALPGTYALVLRVSGHLEILVGRLGTLVAMPGVYVYVGSAFGPGGLASRVGRHARAEKKCRWHIDYLVAVATLEAVWYTLDETGRECEWADVLSQMCGATVPLDGFGSSDCRCRTHLFHFQKRPSLRTFYQRLARSIPGREAIYQERPGQLGRGRCC